MHKLILFILLFSIVVIAQPWPPTAHNVVTKWVSQNTLLFRTTGAFPIQDYLRGNFEKNDV